ncbi:MAG: hypothetical protein WBP64_00170 [Nitrososphaeraceae archaeon]
MVLLLDFQEVEINMNLGILSKVFEQISVTENKFGKYGISIGVWKRSQTKPAV